MLNKITNQKMATRTVSTVSSRTYNPTSTPVGGRTASYKHTDTTLLTSEGATGSGMYGGASYGRYMPWYWLLWVFILPLVIWVLLIVFPPQFILEGENNNKVNVAKALGVSILVGWVILLIFWAISAWC